ncbi:MAG: hypothetical protein Q8M80_04795 [Hydrogenophaga sp.]|uniref:hypothetical protein n=1 Tax=Hydrogenophaga sp. TaxID=1904254 RepID=UPI0025C2F661|nr:hypothetical protein [Hydrogenophaga sp.]MDO9505094.1 hypothetical protein [Hydrogenophaga sp.]MDP2250816.1 hypothetical protein [Hydrogenophaga sp.]MDP3203371.1 hypothetical protein [Hydrogenophaga sp.]MDP3626575.1 hypothetical protein [Hydrogenophaga sp.]
MARTLTQQLPHDVALGAPRGVASGGAPLLLQRSDGDFIDAVLDEIASTEGRARLLATRAAARNQRQVLKLFQPIQRQHHLAMLEAWCDTPGTPRLDPARVESAGLVVRRVRRAGSATEEGWMRSRGRLRGWLPVQRIGGAARDPASQLRLHSGHTGVADIDHELVQLALQSEDTLLNEHVVPMFVAPPEVCKAAGKTVYYGIVPTVSGEQAETAPVFDEDNTFGSESADFRNHLVQALRGEAMEFPLDGETLNPAWTEAAEIATTLRPQGLSTDHWNRLHPGGGSRSSMQRFLRLLRQLDGEFNAFAGTSATAQALRLQLAAIALPLKLREGETVARTVNAEVFLRQAVQVLVQRDGQAARPEMPVRWPALPGHQASALRLALSRAVAERFVQLNPAPGRFDDPGAQYVVRAFVRLKPECGCPARIVWSDATEPFVIAPWFEGSGAPPVRIDLPDITAPGLLASLKPNVSFTVPPALQSLLGGNPKDLMEGKPPSGPGMTIGWICSFSIPIITLCAFIVLSIFLSLFDLIFKWMAFIKICIPFPKKGD